jgi:glycosyltransferase 2 family protein
MATPLALAASSLWFRLLVTAAILGYLASQIDLTAAAAAVMSVSRTHLAAVLGLVAIDRMVMIWRWVLLLRASDVEITTARAASIFLTSSFVGSFLPAGVGGDLARAYRLSRATAAGSEAVASVAIDRLLGILSLLVMGIIGLVAWTPEVSAEPRAILGIILLAAISAGAFYADRLVRGTLPKALHQSIVGRRLFELGDAVARYRDRRSVLLQVFGWSMVVQVLRITQAYLLGLGLAIAVPFRYYLLFMPVGLLMLLLPISISGFGLPQGVIVWLLRPMGVPDEQSFALSTLIVLTGLAGNLPGLVLWLRRSPARALP